MYTLTHSHLDRQARIAFTPYRGTFLSPTINMTSASSAPRNDTEKSSASLSLLEYLSRTESIIGLGGLYTWERHIQYM